MINKLVSIIMPAFNAAETISESIDSVMIQDYQNWELIIVDDNSSDDTSQIVDAYKAKDSRIHLLSVRANLGPAGARNLGIEAARGRWLAFLDSDDLWCKGKLTSQLNFHMSNRVTLSYTQYRRISFDGQKTGHLISVPHRISYYQLLGNTAIATSTVIIDCQTLGHKPVMKSVYYDDFCCWLEILRNGGAAMGLNLDLMRYRVRAGSISRNKFNSAMQVWKIYRNVEGLNIFVSIHSLMSWAFFAIIKYLRF